MKKNKLYIVEAFKNVNMMIEHGMYDTYDFAEKMYEFHVLKLREDTTKNRYSVYLKEVVDEVIPGLKGSIILQKWTNNK